MYMSVGFSNMNLCGHLGTSPLSIADDQPKGVMDLPPVYHSWGAQLFSCFTHFPTPMTARVYVNLLEGKYYYYLNVNYILLLAIIVVPKY